VQYFFPFLPRPFSSTFEIILLVFSRKCSKSSCWNHNSPGFSIRVSTAGTSKISGSSRKEQLLLEDVDDIVE